VLREKLSDLIPGWHPEHTVDIPLLATSTNIQYPHTISTEHITSANSDSDLDRDTLPILQEISALNEQIISLKYELEQISSQVLTLEGNRSSLLLESRKISSDISDKVSNLKQLNLKISEATEHLEKVRQESDKVAKQIIKTERQPASTMADASQQAPQPGVLNNNGGQINLSQFVHHTDDIEQYRYDREPRLFGIGEYMEGYSAPDQVGTTLREPASISIARAAATRQIEGPQDILDLSLLLFYSFGHAPGHEGTKTLLARLEQLRADDATAPLIKTAMEVLWQHARARNVMTSITRMCTGSETDAFIRTFIPESELASSSVLLNDEQDDELPWPVMQ